MHLVKLTGARAGTVWWVNPAYIVAVKPAGAGSSVALNTGDGGEELTVIESVPELLSAIANKRPHAANR